MVRTRSLTEREQQVAEMVGRGLSDKEIAALLVISQHTVRSYLTSMMHKLRARNRTNLAAILARQDAKREGQTADA